jgi:2-C-methyl-D-erythritol 4-phosphate cytidylyltransferase/2-C-methyl-D-erythritol 2,4-cyclodiphosphate synthase
MWRWSADTAASVQEVGEIVLVVPRGVGVGVNDVSFNTPFLIAEGGETRSDSVRNGLEAARLDFVMVHDAARPFVSAALIRSLIENTDADAGALPVLPVSDALKSIADNAISAVPREGIYTTQTPQSFPRAGLIEVLNARRGASFFDEAEAWLADGRPLRHVAGERLNFKVTWPEDVALASLVANERSEQCEIRTGIGYDVHRLTPERRLVLGGVQIESPLGLLGHSDADVLAHAVADAVLGAAGLPDIGVLFPASDERYRGADSMGLLARAVAMAQGEGWEVAWVDAVVEAQVPRLAPHIPAIIERFASVLGDGRFNVRAKSAEMTDDPGMGRSMTCRAVATLRRGGQA